MILAEFKGWPKIPRGNPLHVSITEKMDGTNAAVGVTELGEVFAQSRKRIITPESDNFGFAAWVEEHEEEIQAVLGHRPGHYYGEWVGPGIQKNRHELDEKEFWLFNTTIISRPACFHMVPVLYEGVLTPTTIEDTIEELQQGRDYAPEGVVCYNILLKKYSKHLTIDSNGYLYSSSNYTE